MLHEDNVEPYYAGRHLLAVHFRQIPRHSAPLRTIALNSDDFAATIGPIGSS